MSLFDGLRHDQRAHASSAVYRVADGATLCVSCFCECLSDPAELPGRRHYALKCGSWWLHVLAAVAAQRWVAAGFQAAPWRASDNAAPQVRAPRSTTPHACGDVSGARAPPPACPVAPMLIRRQFIELLDPLGPQPRLLPDVLSKHADLLAAHTLGALADASAARDADLAGVLVEALQVICGGAHFMAEMVADRRGGRAPNRLCACMGAACMATHAWRPHACAHGDARIMYGRHDSGFKWAHATTRMGASMQHGSRWGTLL